MPFAAAENTAAESDKVISYCPGDLNDDEVMRTDDAWLCLREAMGQEILTAEQTVTAQVAGKAALTTAACVRFCASQLDWKKFCNLRCRYRWDSSVMFRD